MLYVDPSGLVSVVFVASEFKEQADIRAKRYTDHYKTESYVFEIDSAKNFNNTWEYFFTIANRTGTTIDAIEIICHGSISGKIGMDESGTGYATSYMIFGDDTRVYARETNDMRSCDSSLSSISNVTAKELNVSSCNSANKDVYNVVWGFMQKTDIRTYSGFDGGAMWDSSGDYVRGGGDYKRTLKHPFDGYHYVKKYQKTWWRYVEKDADGSPARIREVRRTFNR